MFTTKYTMAIFKFHWFAVAAFFFVDVIQAQRRDENFNYFGRQPIPQNVQVDQSSQPPSQFHGQQRWATPVNNAGANRQSYNDEFQRAAPLRTSGADLNRPYNGEFQQGPPRITNNAINRPYNLRPRPLGTADNGLNRSPGNYAGFQRGFPEQNRPLTNGPQRQLIAIDNAPNNGQTRGAANDYGQIRPYVINPQRPFLPNDNLRDRPVYYGGPRRPNESNTPIYIRRVQKQPTPSNDALNQPIYNAGGPIRVIDSESNKPINLSTFQSKPVASSDAGLTNQTKLEVSNAEQSKETDNEPDINGAAKETKNDVIRETSSTLSDQPKHSSTSSDSKHSSTEITKESNNDSTLSFLVKSDKTSVSETVNSTTQKQKQINKLEVTTSSSVHKNSSLNTSEVEKTDITKEV